LQHSVNTKDTHKCIAYSQNLVSGNLVRIFSVVMYASRKEHQEYVSYQF